MLEELKIKFVELLKELGYTVIDNRRYDTTTFPVLLLRTTNHKRFSTFDMRLDTITFTIDIFSSYAGEKEIISIVEDIGDNINTLREDDRITYIIQNGLKILSDNTTGPVREHGILTFQFILASGLEDIDETDSL